MVCKNECNRLTTLVLCNFFFFCSLSLYSLVVPCIPLLSRGYFRVPMLVIHSRYSHVSKFLVTFRKFLSHKSFCVYFDGPSYSLRLKTYSVRYLMYLLVSPFFLNLISLNIVNIPKLHSFNNNIP